MLGECLGLPPGRVDELLWQSGFSASCDAGRYRDAAAIRAQIRRITGYAGPDERLDTAWCSAFCPDRDVTGLLARRPGGRRGVFTNNGPLEEEVLTRGTRMRSGRSSTCSSAGVLPRTSLTPPSTGRSPICWRCHLARSALPTTALTMSRPRWPAGGTQSAIARPATSAPLPADLRQASARRPGSCCHAPHHALWPRRSISAQSVCLAAARSWRQRCADGSFRAASHVCEGAGPVHTSRARELRLMFPSAGDLVPCTASAAARKLYS